MFTLHHGFWLYFLSRRHPKVWQFVAGSMLPDYIYIVLTLVMVAKRQILLTELASLSPTTFLTYLPLYPWAMQVDLLGHSVVVWGALFGLSLLPGLNRSQAFLVGWGTHLFLDGITHAAHANLFLYPLSLAAVHSPISYWEPTFYAREFKIVNGTLMGIVALYLGYHWWKKHHSEE